MEWFGQNWIWVLFMVAFVAMHLFGHGGHGGHGSHNDSKPAEKTDVPPASGKPGGHQH